MVIQRNVADFTLFKRKSSLLQKKKKTTQNTAVNLMLTLSQKISRKLLFPIFFVSKRHILKNLTINYV